MRLLTSVFTAVIMSFSQHSLSHDNQWEILQRQYKASIEDAAMIEPDEIIPVKAITADTQQFVTWTSYPDSYKLGEDITLSWGETWVTLDKAVQKQCMTFDKQKLDLRIQQLLGLPPQQQARDRYFVILTVNTNDMFRPCANGSLLSEQCEAEFPENATEEHKAWYAGQSANSYQTPNGYPWTRLGYTYNWNPEANEVGVFEFVIKKGASVNVVSVTPTKEYCQ